MIVAFCGHSKIESSTKITDWLLSTCEQLIEEGADTFYLGGYGAFDRLARQTVKILQRTHMGLTSVLVMPYPNWNVNLSEYDKTIYPPLENVPQRFAISRRNLWMAEKADVMVAYVTHDWGGACKTMEYACRKKKRIIQYQAI